VALLPLTRPIFALFLAYGLVFVVASGVTRGERARRVRALAVWVCSLGPAVFLLFWCFVAGFGALVLNPAAEPAPDTVEGVVEPAPLVTAQAVPPFVVGRVVIECLGNGRSYHVSETMAGPRRINLRAPSGRTVTVEVPVVGPWADSREWRDAAPRRDNLNVEDADEVDTLEGVPGSDVALQRCPPTRSTLDGGSACAPSVRETASSSDTRSRAKGRSSGAATSRASTTTSISAALAGEVASAPASSAWLRWPPSRGGDESRRGWTPCTT
jgi:hypothetical protein